MERFLLVKIFRKKITPFEVLPFYRFYRNDRNFLYHLFGLLAPDFTSRESENFTGILKMAQLNPVPVFGAKKIPVPFDGNFPPKFLGINYSAQGIQNLLTKTGMHYLEIEIRGSESRIQDFLELPCMRQKRERYVGLWVPCLRLV